VTTKYESKKYEWAISLFVFFSAIFFYQGASPNANSRFNLAKALAENHTVVIDEFAANTVDKAYHDGHFYSDKAPGMAFLGALTLVAINPLLGPLKLSEETRSNVQLYILGCILVAGIMAWAARLYFCFGMDLLGPRRTAMAAALTLVCFQTTFLWPYATILFSHGATAAWLWIAFYYVTRTDLQEMSRASLLLLATFIAYGGMIEFTAGPLFALLYLVVMNKTWTRHGWVLLVPGGLLAGLLGYYNFRAFGSPLSLGYANLEGTPFAAGMEDGFFGINTPSWSRIYHLLFSGYRGLFYYNPILLMAVFGLWYGLSSSNMAKRRLSLGAIAVFAYFLLANASYNFWQGGACYGPRHLIPVIPFLFLAVFMLPSTWRLTPLLWTLSFTSWIFMLVGTAVILTPYERMPNPFWEYLFPYFRAGFLSVSGAPILGDGTISAPARAWASFNLGELMGLKEKLSLLPLVLFQSGMVVWMFGSPLKTSLKRLIRLTNLKTIRPAVGWPVVFGASVFLVLVLVKMYPGFETVDERFWYRPWLDPIDLSVFYERGRWLADGLIPYREVFAEYPLLTVLLFGLMRAVAQSLPEFFLLNLAVQGLAVYMFVKIARQAVTKTWWLAVIVLLPGSLYFGINRFDMLVGCAIGILAHLILERRPISAGLVLGALFYTKWIPALYGPVILFYLVYSGEEKRRREALKFSGTTAAVVVLGTLVSLLWIGKASFEIPILWQMERLPNEGSLPRYLGMLTPLVGEASIGLGQKILGVAQYLVCLVPLVYRPTTAMSLLISLIFVNNAFVFFSKIVSPQWVLWDLALWILVLSERQKARKLTLKLWLMATIPNVISYLFFPIMWDLVRSQSIYFAIFGGGVLILRAAYLVLLLGLLKQEKDIDKVSKKTETWQIIANKEILRE
jgi:hypothetical protein